MDDEESRWRRRIREMSCMNKAHAPSQPLRLLADRCCVSKLSEVTQLRLKYKEVCKFSLGGGSVGRYSPRHKEWEGIVPCCAVDATRLYQSSFLEHGGTNCSTKRDRHCVHILFPGGWLPQLIDTSVGRGGSRINSKITSSISLLPRPSFLLTSQLLASLSSATNVKSPLAGIHEKNLLEAQEVDDCYPGGTISPIHTFYWYAFPIWVTIEGARNFPSNALTNSRKL